EFNHLVTVILGNISVAKMRTSMHEELATRLTQAEKACFRAKDLTQQLLTFAKGGASIRKTASMIELIKEASDFAARGSSVRCEMDYPAELWPAEVDEGQISQVFHN